MVILIHRPLEKHLPSAGLSLWINNSDTLCDSRSTRGCKFAWRIRQSPDQIFIPLCKLCQTAPQLWGLLSCLMSPTQPYGIALRIGFSVFYFLPLHLSCSAACKSAITSQWHLNVKRIISSLQYILADTFFYLGGYFFTLFLRCL